MDVLIISQRSTASRDPLDSPSPNVTYTVAAQSASSRASSHVRSPYFLFLIPPTSCARGARHSLGSSRRRCRERLRVGELRSCQCPELCPASLSVGRFHRRSEWKGRTLQLQGSISTQSSAAINLCPLLLPRSSFGITSSGRLLNYSLLHVHLGSSQGTLDKTPLQSQALWYRTQFQLFDWLKRENC